MNRWTRRLIVIAATLIVLKFLVPSLERRMVFFPFSGEDATPATVNIGYQPVTIATSDGERLAAWQLEPESPVADVVYFHGNGGNLSLWLPVFAALHGMDLRVLAIDYRGYGLSTGTPSEEGLVRDAEAVARHAHRHRTDGRPVIYWGRSLGGAVAAAATRVEPPDGLILESTFPDKTSVIRWNPLLRALNVFSTYRFPTLEWLGGFTRPVLVMHGDRDSVIPYRLGQELYGRLESPKTFLTIRDGDHNDPFGITRRDYWDPVLAFIGSLSSTSASPLP